MFQELEARGSARRSIPELAKWGLLGVKVVTPCGEISWERKLLMIDVVDRCYQFLSELLDRRCAAAIIERLKLRDPLPRWNDDGWALVATRGSHRQYRHPTKPGRVTIAGKPSDDLAPGTLNSILKQAGLKETKS
jgi:predicted RNA binding protein YcfA (HicA-like mRNA interferase family)